MSGLEVIKRNGTRRTFKSSMILTELQKAAANNEAITDLEVLRLSNKIVKFIKSLKLNEITVEGIEDIIYKYTYQDYPTIYSSYKEYHQDREKIRILKTDLMKTLESIEVETDRDNANVGNNFSSKLLRAASTSNKYLNLGRMPKAFAKLHENGELYYHDLDSYSIAPNCLHIPTAKMLTQGFNTGYGTTNRPMSIRVAANLSCILLQSAQNDMFGGQAHPDFDNDLAPYVENTRQLYKMDMIFEKRVQVEIFDKCSEQVLSDLIDLTDKVADKLSRWQADKIIEDFQVKDDDLIAVLKEIEKLGDQCLEEIKSDKVSFSKAEQIIIESNTLRETRQAMQSIVYNLNTMHSRAGSQVPFSSLNIGLPRSKDAALVCKLLLEEYEKGLGKGEQPIFPNIIFRCKKGVNRGKGAPYLYLYKLACRVTAKRMNPTYMNMDASFNYKYYSKGIIPATMGCRTYICSNINGQEGPVSRGNNAPATINLPRIAFKIRRFHKDYEVGSEAIKAKYLEELSKMINLAKESLIQRYKVLKRLKVKDLPFVAGQGLMMGSENLDPMDSIDPILKNGTWGIGFIGLAETLQILLGKHHGESEEAQQFGLAIVGTIRDMCDKYTQELKMNFSCYATPAEGLSSYFTDKDRKYFGDVKGIISKGYYTNSFQIPVDFKISIADKFRIEAPYHALCNGGHISYGELDGTPTGDIIESIIDAAYDTTDINYIGLNFHIRYCKDCGTSIFEHESRCPKCGSSDIQGISRVTGYLSLDERFGKGKVKERAQRVSHTGEIGTPLYTGIQVNANQVI